jgi:hypothetical protein
MNEKIFSLVMIVLFMVFVVIVSILAVTQNKETDLNLHHQCKKLWENAINENYTQSVREFNLELYKVRCKGE